MSGVEGLLDANAVIAWQGGDPDMSSLVLASGRLAIPLFVAGELHYGAMNSVRREGNHAALARLMEEFPVMYPDAGTIPVSGTIRHSLRRKGRPIPGNDVWIAALCIQHGVPVITRDAHFLAVEGLRLET